MTSTRRLRRIRSRVAGWTGRTVDQPAERLLRGRRPRLLACNVRPSAAPAGDHPCPRCGATGGNIDQRVPGSQSKLYLTDPLLSWLPSLLRGGPAGPGHDPSSPRRRSGSPMARAVDGARGGPVGRRRHHRLLAHPVRERGRSGSGHPADRGRGAAQAFRWNANGSTRAGVPRPELSTASTAGASWRRNPSWTPALTCGPFRRRSSPCCWCDGSPAGGCPAQPATSRPRMNPMVSSATPDSIARRTVRWLPAGVRSAGHGTRTGAGGCRHAGARPRPGARASAGRRQRAAPSFRSCHPFVAELPTAVLPGFSAHLNGAASSVGGR